LKLDFSTQDNRVTLYYSISHHKNSILLQLRTVDFEGWVALFFGGLLIILHHPTDNLRHDYKNVYTKKLKSVDKIPHDKADRTLGMSSWTSHKDI